MNCLSISRVVRYVFAKLIPHDPVHIISHPVYPPDVFYDPRTMAFKNKTIRNPVTGQDITFLQTSKDTGGALLEMIATYHQHSGEPPEHFHPFQEEDFTVISGELTVRIDDIVTVLRARDTLHIAPNKRHAMWNSSATKTVVNWQVRPALDTEYLLETLHGLAAEGKTDTSGKPSLWQIALTAPRFSNVFRLTSPPYGVQKVVFNVLKPVARLLGYRATYDRHID